MANEKTYSRFKTIGTIICLIFIAFLIESIITAIIAVTKTQYSVDIWNALIKVILLAVAKYGFCIFVVCAILRILKHILPDKSSVHTTESNSLPTTQNDTKREQDLAKLAWEAEQKRQAQKNK